MNMHSELYGQGQDLIEDEDDRYGKINYNILK